MSAIVNDILNVSSLSQLAASSNNRLPVDLSGTSADLHASGLSSINLYYRISSGGAFTLTLPANYSLYKGRVLHLVNGVSGAWSIIVAQSSASSGLIRMLDNSTNASGTVTIFGATSLGQWISLVCDGSTGWFAFSSSA